MACKSRGNAFFWSHRRRKVYITDGFRADFEPTTGWAYGPGTDWLGKLIERVTEETLEPYMAENIWGLLHMTDMTCCPKEREDMKHRIAALSELDSDRSNKAVYTSVQDVTGGATDCLGGVGAPGQPQSINENSSRRAEGRFKVTETAFIRGNFQAGVQRTVRSSAQQPDSLR